MRAYVQSERPPPTCSSHFTYSLNKSEVMASVSRPAALALLSCCLVFGVLLGLTGVAKDSRTTVPSSAHQEARGQGLRSVDGRPTRSMVSATIMRGTLFVVLTVARTLLPLTGIWQCAEMPEASGSTSLVEAESTRWELQFRVEKGRNYSRVHHTCDAIRCSRKYKIRLHYVGAGSAWILAYLIGWRSDEFFVNTRARDSHQLNIVFLSLIHI